MTPGIERPTNGEPARVPPAAAVSAHYAALARSGTTPELLLRRELHRRGRRFRVHARIEGLPRRRVDIAFTRWKVCVLVDGCFWHACPEHGTMPKRNREWWEWKLARTSARDADTDKRLRELGWTVVRIWEHERAAIAAGMVEHAVEAAQASARSPGRTPPRARQALLRIARDDPKLR